MRPFNWGYKNNVVKLYDNNSIQNTIIELFSFLYKLIKITLKLKGNTTLCANKNVRGAESVQWMFLIKYFSNGIKLNKNLGPFN